MFDIYLENFLDNGQYVDNEVRKVLTIPSSDPTRIWLVSPSFKAEMGKAESFDFSVNPGSPYYNAFVQYKTLIRVVYDGTIICYARVTTINTSGLLQVRAIHSEGIYSVLKDSQIEGKEEELQSKITATALFVGILSEHNSRISGDSWKTVSMGVIDSGLDSGEAKKQAPTSWSDSLSAIDSILGKHGGYTRVRYEYPSGNPGGHITSYLDWKKDFFRDAGANRPHIQVAKNLIDFSSSSEVSELFTRVIPIGQKSGTTKEKESRYIYLGGMYYPVTRICSDYSAEELNSGFHRYSDYANAERNYGIIYKTLNFANADNTSKLLSYTKDWVKKNYYGALRTFTVKAIDMHMLGDSDPKILVGDCVDFTYPEYDSNGRTVLITRKLVCKAVNYNLFNPDQSSYTLGIPSDLLDFEYGEKKKTKKSSSTAAAAAKPSGGGGSKPKVVTWSSILEFLYYYYYGKTWGSYENSIENHAYSWHVRGLGKFGDDSDKRPHSTFLANGEYKGQHVEEKHWEPGTTDDPTIIDNEYVSVEYVDDFYYANFQGVGKARIYGHYKTSSCRELYALNHPDLGKMKPADRNTLLSKIPTPERYGYEYGVACVEGTADVFAFGWNEYARNHGSEFYTESPAIAIKFYFSGFEGSSHDVQTAPADGADLPEEAPEGVPVTEDPQTHKIEFFDDEGNPSAEIFPTYGSMKFGNAYDPYEWEYDDGTVAEPNAEGAHPKRMYDDDGNPIWAIALNAPVQMLNPDYDPTQQIDPEKNPKYITLGGEGILATNDISLPNMPSFQTEVAVIRDAIIQRATIGELRAYVAELGAYQDVDDVDINDILEGEWVYHYEDADGNIVSKDYPGAQKKYDLDENEQKIPLKDEKGNQLVKVKDGTRFKVQQDHIQGVTGRFVLHPDGTMDIIEGGGINIRRNEASFGLWDKGELAAGIFTAAVNDETGKTYYTSVKGDYVVLGSDLDNATVKEWAQDSADGSGVFARYFRAKRITADDITADDSLEVNGLCTVSKSLIVGSVGDGSLTYVRGSGIQSSRLQVNMNGELAFRTGRDSEVVITSTGAEGLVQTSTSHVQVVDNEDGTYTLWYLPVTIARTISNNVPSTETGWINAGNFNRAASGGALTASWSGSSPRNNLIIADESQAHEYVINFGNSRQISGKTINDIVEVINIDDNGDEYENTVSTASYSNGKYLIVPYRIVKTIPSTGAEDDSYTTIFNGVLGAVNATPVYNNGWNAAADVAALNPVIVNSQVTKDLYLVKPKKNDPGNSQTVGYYVDVDTNYAYVKDPNDTVVAKVDNTAADRNRSSRIGNNVPNYYNISDDEYDNASADHKFALTRYGSRYSVVTQYQKRDGTYANGDIYYVTTPADRYNDGKNDIINAGGPISQNGAVSNRAINKYVTTLTVTGINATGNISITNRQNVSNTAGLSALATALGASGQNQLSNMFQTDPGSYNQYYGIKVECPSASNTPQYYYFKTPDDRYDSGKTDGFNSVSGSNVDLRDITKTNGIRGNIYIQRSGGNWVNARSFSISMPANSSASWKRALKNASTYVYSCTVAGTTYTHEWSKGS